MSLPALLSMLDLNSAPSSCDKPNDKNGSDAVMSAKGQHSKTASPVTMKARLEFYKSEEDDEESTDDEKSVEAGKPRQQILAGQSFTSCDSSSYVESEIEIAEQTVLLASEDKDFAREVPMPSKLMQIRGDCMPKDTGLTSMAVKTKPTRSRRSNSLITKAHKALLQQEQFVFEPQVEEEEEPTDASPPEAEPAGAQYSPPKRTSGRRKKAKSLITLAQKAQRIQEQQLEQHLANEQMIQASEAAEALNTTPCAVVREQLSLQAYVETNAKACETGFCNGCGAAARPHFKFCLFCGLRLG